MSGTRAATIEDVAREAGVSRAAVSKVIRNAYGVSPSMRDRVTAAIEALDYRPRVAARAMRGSSFTLGIEMPHIGNPFFTKIMAGATAARETPASRATSSMVAALAWDTVSPSRLRWSACRPGVTIHRVVERDRPIYDLA